MEFLNSLQSFLQASCKAPPSSLSALADVSQQFRSILTHQLVAVFEKHNPNSTVGALSLKELALVSACMDLVAIWIMDIQLFTSAVLPSPSPSRSINTNDNVSSSFSSSETIAIPSHDQQTTQIKEHIQYILYQRCVKLARTLGGMGATPSLLYQGIHSILTFYFANEHTQSFSSSSISLSSSSSLSDSIEFRQIHQCLIDCYIGFRTLLTHKYCDPRLIDKLVPVLYATALVVDRRAHLYPSLPSLSSTDTKSISHVQSLLDTFPPRVSAQAFMWLASGQYIAVMASGNSTPSPSSSSASVPSPSSSPSTIPIAPPKLCSPFNPLLLIPSWLRVSAAASLAKLSMQGGGIEGILDAFFSGIDIENALAVDRIRNQINTILSKPPLETCTPYQYFSSLGKQLLPLLRLGGKDAYLMTTTVALLIGHLLSNHEYSSIIQETILQPLLHPLLTIASPPVFEDSSKKRIDPHAISRKVSKKTPLIEVIEESTEQPNGISLPVSSSESVHYTQVLVNENDLMGCVEDWHKILSSSPSLLLNTQTSRLLIELSPLWLDIYLRTSTNKILNNFSTAVQEVLARILNGIPTYLGTIIILRILYDTDIVPNDAIILSVTSSLNLSPVQTQEIRNLLQALRYRHQFCGLTMGEYGGLRVSGYTYPVTLEGQSLLPDNDEREQETVMELRLPSSKSSRSKNNSSSSSSLSTKAGLSSLLHINGDNNASSISSMNALYSEKEHDPKTHSTGLDGPSDNYGRTLSSVVTPSIENHTTRYAKLANAIVDILLEVKVHRGNDSAVSLKRTGIQGSESIAGYLFTYLLQEYSTYRIQLLSDTNASLSVNDTYHKEQSIHSLQLLITLTERLGPQVLRSSVQIIQAIRNTLVIIIVALGLPIPDPSTVGCTGTAADIHNTHIPVGANLMDGNNSTKANKAIPSLIDSTNTNEDTTELISTCLGLLTVVMTGSNDDNKDDHSSDTRSVDEEKGIVYWLRSCLPLLASLQYYNDTYLQEMATALRAAILLVPEIPSSSSSPSIASSTVSKDSAKLSADNTADDQTIQEAISLILDPAPALQANGIRIIGRIVRTDPLLLRSSAGVSGIYTTVLSPKASTLFDLVIRQIETTEPYVYLAAIECLQAFASTYPVAILPKILRLYTVSETDNEDVTNERMDTLSKETKTGASGDISTSSSSVNLSIRARVKLGEVLSLCTIGAGRSGTLPAYASPILGALLRIGISGWKRQEMITNKLIDAGTFVTNGTIKTTNTAEVTDHKSSFGVKDTNEIYNLTLRLQDFTDLRSSALACLGEISAYLGYTLAIHIQDILGGLTGVLTMEIQSRTLSKLDRTTIDPEVITVIEQSWIKVRRSAGYALRRLIEGDSLGRGNGHISLFDNPATMQYLREIHQLVQRIMITDPDTLVRSHANDASVAMDTIVKRYITNTSSASKTNIPQGIGRIVSPGTNYRPLRSSSSSTASSSSTGDSYIDQSQSSSPSASLSTVQIRK